MCWRGAGTCAGREIARQLSHPLALLLWLAAVLSFAVGSIVVAVAVVLVIILNAAFAFGQELQAERAVEALAAYMPQHATVLRDGKPTVIESTGWYPVTSSCWSRAPVSPPTCACCPARSRWTCQR